MYMQVRHGLSRVVALVYYQSVAAAEFQLVFKRRYFFHYSAQRYFVVCAHFGKIFKMLFGYAQKNDFWLADLYLLL